MMQHLSKEVMVPSHADLPTDACSSRDSHGTGLSQLSHRNHMGPPRAADSISIEISLTPSPLPITLGFRSLKPRLEQPSPSAFSFFAKPWIPDAQDTPQILKTCMGGQAGLEEDEEGSSLHTYSFNFFCVVLALGAGCLQVIFQLCFQKRGVFL